MCHAVICHAVVGAGVLGGMTEHSTLNKVIVIGGGYAGALAANSLRAPDVTLTADSGGKTRAARRPVVGATRVAEYLVTLFRAARELPDVRIEVITYNSTPALVAHRANHLEGIYLVEVANERITNLYAVRNPDKLAAATVPRRISR